MENFNSNSEREENLVSLVEEGIKNFNFTAGSKSSYGDFLDKLSDEICEKSSEFEKNEVILEIRRQIKLKGMASLKKDQMDKIVDDMDFNDIE